MGSGINASIIRQCIFLAEYLLNEGKANHSMVARLQIIDVTKSFPGVKALRGVSMEVREGEVLAVIGENGAGKSTLMKILAGVQGPDSGQLLWNGKPVTFRNTAESQQCGISLIHQELNLAGNLNLAANIFLGREPHRLGWIDQGKMHREAAAYLEQVGLKVSTKTLAGDLSIGQQQQVEIAKALSCDARVLIMDEPTSSLSSGEAEKLFELIKQLRKQGVSIVYISHRLGEVGRLADRVEVLRDGANAGRLEKNEITHQAMVRLMVGRELSQYFPHQEHPQKEVRLKVEDLIVAGKTAQPISFEVRGGEIVGMAGLVGAGRTEVVETLLGIRPALGGRVFVDGKNYPLGNPKQAIQAGLALVPEDRRHQGLMTAMSVEDNLVVVSLENRSRLGWIDRKGDRQAAQSQVDSLKIKTPHLQQTAAYLSGGNQQKIVLGKWILNEPKVLMLDEPTRGVDIGAKQEIYMLMEKLAAEGVAILFVSSEMEEILGMADRVLVMHEGRISGELPRAQLSEEAIMELAVGGVTAAITS
jgi:ribose transport system ATP-binding protein